MAEPELWDEFSERLRDLETAEHAPEIISPFLALPGLRGFWPMSAFQSNGDCFDQSGNGRLLTYNGNPTYNYDGLAPYLDMDGVGDYLGRADEAGLDILGTETYVAAGVRGLTLGGWFRADSAGAGAGRYLIAKATGAAATSSYAIYISAANNLIFFVSNGAAAFATPGIAITHDTWFFAAGRYDPSTEVKLWLDDATTTNVAGIPAALNNSNTQFSIGATGTPTLHLDGRASLCSLCAAMLSDGIILSLFQQTRAAFGV